jgi:tetratricopeptide (TPR) repeat protein
VVALLLIVLIGGGIAARHGWAWYHLDAGRAALAAYRNDRARTHLEKCLAVWPENAEAHLLAARAERRAGRFAEAEQHIDECRKWAGPDMSDAAALEWALLHAAMGDLRSVEDSLQARLLKRPAEAPLIWEALSTGYRRVCRMPDALACLNTWLAFEPGNAHAYFLRGEVHRQIGAVNRARDEYAKVVELDPGHDEARRHLARCLVKVGRYQDAAGHLETLLCKFPGDPELQALLARTVHDRGERERSIALLDEVLQAYPDYGPALRERGRIALVGAQFADAEGWLRQAAEALPYDYEVHFALQQALQGQGRDAEAKKQLALAQQLQNRSERVNQIETREMTLRPSDAALHAELGELLIGLGRHDSGERWLQSSLQLDPQLPAAHAALARYYEKRGDTARAAYHRERAELKRPRR